MSRVPLALLFALLAARPWAALAILALAAVSDVLDGWAARRDSVGPARTAHGAWLDPLCDKIFMAAVVVGVFRVAPDALPWLLLTVSREMIQAVSLLLLRLTPRLRRLRYDYAAHPWGKATTVLQFCAAATLVFGLRMGPFFAGAAGLFGLLAVGIYLRRMRELAKSAAAG